jgi:hypothetical protein
MAASTRLRTPSLPREALTWAFTVPSTRCSRAPISALESSPHSPPLNEPPFTGRRRPRVSVLVAVLVALEGLGQGLGDTSRFQPDGWLDGRPRQRAGRKLLVDGFTTKITSPPGASACLSIRPASICPAASCGISPVSSQVTAVISAPGGVA